MVGHPNNRLLETQNRIVASKALANLVAAQRAGVVFIEECEERDNLVVEVHSAREVPEAFQQPIERACNSELLL